MLILSCSRHVVRIQVQHRIADQGKDITEGFLLYKIILRPSKHLEWSPLRKTKDLRKSLVSIPQDTISRCPSLVTGVIICGILIWKTNWSLCLRRAITAAVSRRAFSHITCVKCMDSSINSSYTTSHISKDLSLLQSPSYLAEWVAVSALTPSAGTREEHHVTVPSCQQGCLSKFRERLSAKVK